MKDQARKLSQRADSKRESGQLARAGRLYTAAAFEYAGAVTEHIFPEPDRTYSALSKIARAATCYRIAGDQFRTQNRCRMGIELAQDYRDFIDKQEIEPKSFADIRRGALPEYIGDLRTIAERDDAADAYDRAAEIYERCDEWEWVMGEQEHRMLTGYFRGVKRGAGYEVSRTDLENMPLDESTFSDWLAYKRERLPELLDELEATGEWSIESR